MKSFSMYTPEGDAVAAKIVELADLSGVDWPTLLKIMTLTADNSPDTCGELLDTEVREIIYSRCGYTTPFYV